MLNVNLTYTIIQVMIQKEIVGRKTFNEKNDLRSTLFQSHIELISSS